MEDLEKYDIHRHSRSKRAFGSFFSSNVEELLTFQDWIAPPLPFDLPSELSKWLDPEVPTQISTTSIIACGQSMDSEELKKLLFHLTDKYTFLNHGAFGAALRPIQELQYLWMQYIDSQPVKFFDREIFSYLCDNIRSFAEYVRLQDPRELVLIQNATYGMNAVMKGLLNAVHLQTLPPELNNAREYVIVHFSFTYPSTIKLLKSIVEQASHIDMQCVTGKIQQSKPRIRRLEIPICLPILSFEEIISSLVNVLKKNWLEHSVSLAVILDIIPSTIPISLPIQEIIAACREVSPQTFIVLDGAHFLGSNRIDLSKLDADFLVCNCHKWLCAPKGTAFLWCPKKNQYLIPPLIVSHGYGSGFSSSYAWQGLQNYSSWLVLKHVVSLSKRVFPNGVCHITRPLLDAAAALLSTKWGTSLPIPLELCKNSPMRLVELPQVRLIDEDSKIDYCVAEKVQNALFFDHQIEVPIKALFGKLYVRISGHVYNHISNFEHLASAVLLL
ncbi:putative Isopenicillin N epimerase [Cardiosporidium cionae]|uniref:Isopenicillin N epimerase n=1 Tax=Cardiosporidium cionae TaxID=476202 RepID=A0ABQ7JDX7_9APIC|nr:putative Isopenicillin N epimerase [Cardiosporidium cionae]|eukprot:KAF8822204.1 putative Isopenicillin N epimerase [Cardiosporidium cionae]